MNLKLKSEVLAKSIHIETYLSQILMTLLDIESINNRTLGTKGSALSFKAKTDLLYDINKINKELYTDLIIFMEIRNQFIHNFDTNSYEIVIKRIGKEKRLLELFAESKIENGNIKEKEEKLKFGFSHLSISIFKRLEIIEEKTQALKRKIEILEKSHDLEFKEITQKALADSIDDAMELLNSNLNKSDLGRHLNTENELTNSIKTSIFMFMEKNMRKEIDEWKVKNES